MSFPFDLAKKVILDICSGKTIEQASEETGFSVEAIEKFFADEVNYTYQEFSAAEGITGYCLAPYYTEIFPLVLNHDVRNLIVDAIDSFGNIMQEATVQQNSEGVFVNDTLVNCVAFHTFDASNPLGIIYVAATGFYTDDCGVLHELDVYHSERVTEETYHLYHSDTIPVVGRDEQVARNAFKAVFKALHNDYRV